MKQRVIHVFTHDSIGLGEDGPTHQPVEHAATLRLIPNLDVWRPATPPRPWWPGPWRIETRRMARPRCCCRARTFRIPKSTPTPKGAYVLGRAGGSRLKEGARR